MKKWYQSKTIWGIIISIIGYVMNNFLNVEGADLPINGDFEQIKNYAIAIHESKNSWTNLFGNLISAFGFILAIFGRVKADTGIQIGKSKK